MMPDISAHVTAPAVSRRGQQVKWKPRPRVSWVVSELFLHPPGAGYPRVDCRHVDPCRYRRGEAGAGGTGTLGPCVGGPG